MGVACDIMEQHIVNNDNISNIDSDIDNNDNVDNVLHASVWFECFGGLFECQNPWYMSGQFDNKEEDLSWARPFTRVLEYKRGSNITKVRVYTPIYLRKIEWCQHVINWTWKH